MSTLGHFWRVSLLGGALLIASGCEEAREVCLIATEGCSCTPSGHCDPGLACWSNLCVRPTDAGPGTSTSVMAPPPPPPLTGGVDAAPRDGGIGLTTDGGGAPASRARWTVFIYGHGDHNLSPTLLADLAEMSRAALTDEVRVLALVDWNAKAKLPGKTAESFPAGTFLVRPLGGGKLETVGTAAELDFDDPTVLADAIGDAFTRYPADRYGLVLWDHGGAFRGGFGGDTQNGTRRGNPLSVPALAAAVKAGLDKAGLTGVRPLDFLALDTCLMSGVEVQSAFSETAKIYIANAELDYGPGLDYEKSLGWLAANPTASALEFARAESMLWDAHHRQATRVDGLYRSHAAWDMARWGDFQAAARTLATTIRNNNAAAEAARAMFFSLPSYYKASNANGLDLRDVGDVLRGLAGSRVAPVANAARDTLVAAQAARIAGANGELRTQQIGLHMFGGLLARLAPAPLQAYPRLAAAWSTSTGWDQLLGYLTGAVTPGTPQFTGMETLPATPTRQDPPRVEFQTTDPDIAYAEAIVLARDPADDQVLINHGTITHGIIGPGRHTVLWPGQVLGIAATPEDVRVTVSPWSFTAEGGMTASRFRVVNGTLRDATGDELAVGLLVDENNEASELVLNEEDGFRVLSLRRVIEAAGTVTFIPTLDIVNARNEAETTRRGTLGVVVPASGKLSLRQGAVGAGRYLLGVYVVDVWGKHDAKVFGVTLTAPVAP